jgi:hypothetical protein
MSLNITMFLVNCSTFTLYLGVSVHVLVKARKEVPERETMLHLKSNFLRFYHQIVISLLVIWAIVLSSEIAFVQMTITVSSFLWKRDI